MMAWKLAKNDIFSTAPTKFRISHTNEGVLCVEKQSACFI